MLIESAHWHSSHLLLLLLRLLETLIWCSSLTHKHLLLIHLHVWVANLRSETHVTHLIIHHVHLLLLVRVHELLLTWWHAHLLWVLLWETSWSTTLIHELLLHHLLVRILLELLRWVSSSLHHHLLLHLHILLLLTILPWSSFKGLIEIV